MRQQTGGQVAQRSDDPHSDARAVFHHKGVGACFDLVEEA
jgi:hypothetical protein